MMSSLSIRCRKSLHTIVWYYLFLHGCCNELFGVVRGQELYPELRNARTLQKESMYEEMCSDQGTDNDNSTSSFFNMGKTMGRMCICNFLRDQIPVDTSLQSIRRRSSNSGGNPASSQTVAELRCTNGIVSTPSNGDYKCANVDLLSFISANDLISIYGDSDDTLSSLWGYTHASTNQEIAIVGTFSGFTFVDVTIPTDPIIIGKVKPSGFIGVGSFWHDVRTYQDHAYMVTEDGNMQYINMTTVLNLNYSDSSIGINLTPYTKEYDSMYDLSNVHTIEINQATGYAYLVGSNLCSGSLYVVDIRNPANPVEAGCNDEDGYVHETQCVIYNGPDTPYVGLELCFACNTDAVTIYDVSNKADIKILSSTSYDNVGYTHQGSLTNDHKYFIFGDELDEFATPTKTLVLDVSSITNPFLTGYHLKNQGSIDHNQYVIGNFSYQANYQSGFSVLRLDDLSTARMTEVAYFDIFPDGDEASFNGAWMVYPYFQSGSILVSGIEQGLFILKVDENAINIPNTSTNGTCRNDNQCRRRRFKLFGSDTSDENTITMYKGKRSSPFFNLLLCRQQCVVESSILTMIDEGWTCGTCRE